MDVLLFEGNVSTAVEPIYRVVDISLSAQITRIQARCIHPVAVTFDTRDFGLHYDHGIIDETQRGKVEHVHNRIDYIEPRVDIVSHAKQETLLQLLKYHADHKQRDQQVDDVRLRRTNVKVDKVKRVRQVRIGLVLQVHVIDLRPD